MFYGLNIPGLPSPRTGNRAKDFAKVYCGYDIVSSYNILLEVQSISILKSSVAVYAAVIGFQEEEGGWPRAYPGGGGWGRRVTRTYLGYCGKFRINTFPEL